MTERRDDGTVDAETLKRVALQMERGKEAVDEARSEMANTQKNAQNDHHIDTMVLKQVLKLKGMSALKRASWIRNFESYCHILGVDAQGELDLGDGEQKPTAEAA